MGRALVVAGFSALALALALPSAVCAHEVRPAYLELRQLSGESYELFFKVPGRGPDLRLALSVELPASCEPIGPRQGLAVGNAFAERWRVRCSGGLAGETVRIAGLEATMTDALARVERRDGAVQLARLVPSAPSFVVEASPSRLAVAGIYARLGIEHILTGIDHLLFVLALILITGGGWRIVKTVTAFTVSHTVTLTLAALGYVHVPPAPVEAVIALSIVFVAAEIVRGRQGRPGVTARAPWLVAFTFGLLHGLGFAGGLAAIGLPVGHIPLALAFFSAGVEIGHFLFVGTVLALLAAARRLPLRWPRWAEVVPAYAIGAVAMFWVLQRIGQF